MSMPGFGAEASLGPTIGRYRGTAVFCGSRTAEVLPMLDRTCGACQPVLGGLGHFRSCCEKVWKWNPITRKLELTWDCTFESCTPSPRIDRWLDILL